jgi:hypothetical protein
MSSDLLLKLKNLITDKVLSKYSSADDVDFINRAIFNGWMISHKSVELSLVTLIKYFLLENKNDLELIDLLMNDLTKPESGFLESIPGAAYYAWAIYNVERGDLNKAKQLLKLATTRKFRNLDRKSIDARLSEEIGWEELMSIGIAN